MCRKYLEEKAKKKVDNVEAGASNVYFMGSVADKKMTVVVHGEKR